MACILIHIMNNGLSVYLSLKHPEMEDVTHLLVTRMYWFGQWFSYCCFYSP